MGLGIEETGKKAKLVFKNIGVELDQTRVMEDSLTFAFLEQLEAIDKIMEKNREAKKVVDEKAESQKNASTATTKALAKEKKQIIDLADAMQGAKQSVLDALNFQDTGLLSNFSKGFQGVVDSQKQCLNKCGI